MKIIQYDYKVLSETNATKKVSQSNYTAINLNMVCHIPKIKILLSYIPINLPLVSAGLLFVLNEPGIFSMAPFYMN